METRELIAGQEEQLVALFRAVLPDSPTAQVENPDAPRAFLQEPNTFMVGAYDGTAPVGLAWGLQMRSPSGRPTTYLHEL